MRLTPRGLLLASLLCTTIAAAAHDRTATLTRKDGSQLTGELVGETPTEYTLMISGIKTVVPTAEVTKVFEVDLTANPPPVVVVPKDVIDTILTKYSPNDRLPKGQAEQDQFRALQGHQQLETIFKALGENARPYYGKIRITRDPESIAS